VSDRVVAWFDRVDRSVSETWGTDNSTREETVLMMLGLCRRAAMLGLANVHAEGLADKAAAQMVDMLLELRDLTLKGRLSS
jgi:hypothetical protein